MANCFFRAGSPDPLAEADAAYAARTRDHDHARGQSVDSLGGTSDTSFTSFDDGGAGSSPPTTATKGRWAGCAKIINLSLN